MRAFWFSDGDSLRYGDTRTPSVGVTHRHDGPLMLCRAGLHASIDVLDAMTFAPGTTLWVVECGGEVILADDKLVCTERTYLSRHEVDLRAFARWCALQVVHLWDCPALVRQYLETGDETLRDAASASATAAARAAAWAAMDAAVWAAMDAAVWAASDAAWSAMDAAAWSASDAAWAAEAAARAARAAAWAAARAAASDAAWNAARAAQRQKLLELAGIS